MISYTNSNKVNSDVIINEYFVKVVDYDGTIIDEQYMHNGEIYTLPSAPSHTGLVFQEWSCSQEIVNNQVIINNNNVMIGPIYTTSSGQCEFDIELTTPTGKAVTLNMDGTKDWGDGTSDTNTTHTYSNYGEYTIKCNGTTMTTSNSSGLFGQSTSNVNYYVKNARFANITNMGTYTFNGCYSLTNIVIPNSVTGIPINTFYICYSLTNIVIPNSVTSIGNYSFYSCYSLTNAVIPNSVTSMGQYSFYGCRSLRNLAIPNSVTSMGQYSFYNCYSLTNIIISNKITSIQNSTFSNCYSLTNVIIPNNITSIGQSAFRYCYSLINLIIPNGVTSITSTTFENCYSMIEYNFSKHTSIPTLSYVSAFNNINGICKIKVPFNLYYDWMNANNWSTYKSYITSTGSATINFTGDNTGDIYVNNNLISGTSTIWGGNKIPYSVYDLTNNVVLPTQIFTGIVENSTQNINIDFSSKKKITLQIGVNGLDVDFIIEGKTCIAVEDNGDYYIYVIGSGTEINYYIDGGSDYMNQTGTITTTGDNITQPISLTPAIDSAWTRPNLTANGTIGGNSFAVSAERAYSDSEAWKAMDNNTSTYWASVEYVDPAYYTFYDPNGIKVSELTFKYYSSADRATDVSIQGSKDGTNWINIESVYSGSSDTYTLTSTNNKYYRYYKLTLKPLAWSTWLSELSITATTKTAS